MVIESQEEKILRSWKTHLLHPVEITMEKTRDPRSEEIAAFVSRLVELVPEIRRETVHTDSEDLPALHIKPGWIIHAVPKGTEFRPFLEILAAASEFSARKSEGSDSPPVSAPSLPPRVQSILAQLDHPKEITVFVGPQCPHCGHMMFDLVPLPFMTPYLWIRVLDAELFPEHARRWNVKSVPTVLFGNNFRWTGRVELSQILEVVCRSPQDPLSAASVIRLLKEGKAEEVARLMIRTQRPWEEFSDVLTHPEWSVRLGALVVMEELSESAPRLAREYLGPLWEKMDHLPLQIQGDVIYAIGIAGDSSWKPILENWVRKNPGSKELQETVSEAVARWENH